MIEAWETKTLGDLCDIYQPKTISKKMLVPDGKYPVYGANGQIGWYDEYNHEESELLITCRGATCGAVNVSPPKAWINGNAMVVHPRNNEIHRPFLRYMFQGAIDLSSVITGAAQPQITRTNLAPVEIRFPESLKEQKRIVAILDEAFGAIDMAKRIAEKNLSNAVELFDSYLNRVFTERREGWEETTLGEIAQFKNGLNFDKHSSGQTLPIVGVGDFQSNFYVPTHSLETATIDGTLDDNYALMKDDILTVRSNGSKDLIGRCMLVPKLNEVTSYSGFVIRIRMDKARIAPRFLLHFMKSRNTVYLLTRDGGGANINNINQKKLSALRVRFPQSLDEQNRLSDQVEELSTCSTQHQRLLIKKFAALDELKQSILQKAFTGQLTAKSPELEAVP